MTRVYVLNGPNLGRLGSRQVDIYGVTSYENLVLLCTGVICGLGVGGYRLALQHIAADPA